MKKNQKSFTQKAADTFDNVIGFFSPEKAAKRKYFRLVSDHLFKSYRGAEYGRFHGNWIPGGGSADQDLLTDLGKLRERSRDLVRNDGIASGAVDTIVTNIIGSGIRPQSRIDREELKIDEEYANELQKQIEKIWKRWAPQADAGNRLNFYQLEELSERQRFVNGESVIIPLRKEDKNRPYSLCLQSVESDRLDTPSDLKSNKSVRSGIEIGQYGEPVSYWIRKNHPGDYSYGNKTSSNNSTNYIQYKALDAFGNPNIFHLYHVKRSGQTRGEPFFAPVLNLFKDRYEYMEAELVAARVAACFAIFIKNQTPQTLINTRSTQDSQGRHIEELSPGLIDYLNPGEDITPFNPNRPGGSFPPFIERILRDIASGLNIPYEILSKDFSKSNYSNTRAALLEARRFFMMQQDFIADSFGQPILALLMEEAYLKGELPILDFYTNKAAYLKTKWISPGWQWVDPENEVSAAVDSVNNNLSTLAEEGATQGQDWEETLEQRAREKRKIKDLEKKFDIDLSSAAKEAKPDKKKDKKDGQKPDGQQPGSEPEDKDIPEEGQEN